jgi:glyceraldehyde-3-phosphate dehydrogenase (NADP+)
MPVSPGELPDTALYVASQRFEDGPRLEVTDPWSGEPLGRVVMADAARAGDATKAAVEAFARTRALSSFERRKILRRVAEGLSEQRDRFAKLIAREAGKPIALALAEVGRAISTFELGAEEATRLGGEVIPLDVTETSKSHAGQWVYVPAGPVVALAPFNFPLNLVAHKVAPALACGCSVVLKPPPQAPLTSLALAALVREAGAPPDALQVVPCDVSVAERLVRDDRFATLSFTGSARVGWHLKSVAGKKRVLLELGGNAAVIVAEDARAPWAIDRVVQGAFGYAGQVCIKVQRLYLHRSIADAWQRELIERTRKIVPTNPLEPGAVMGPMIDQPAAVRVESWVHEAIAAGAVLAIGGGRNGNRMDATILRVEGDGKGLKVVDEEVFGPVLTLHRYDDWEDALRMADDTRYGLQAGIFTDSQERVRRAFQALHVGALVVNDTPTFRVDSMPYGGTRDSGLGREGVRFAIEEMTEKKLLVHRNG